ncbi:OR5BL protein, partial [Penelope pileata]|nr:OR5BL protein [Penelope pileata]
ILLSYICILYTILRMSLAESRPKVFSTCASHLTAVSLFYGTVFSMYLQPMLSHGSLDKVASLYYTVVTPVLNPLIYSLRSQEVK